MNKLFSKIAALSVGLAMAVGVGVAVSNKKDNKPVSVNADDSVVYSMVPVTGGSNGYATDSTDLDISGVKWSATGNTTLTPWRIGGKSLSNVERYVWSQSAVSSEDITKVELEVGAASSITVNSVKLFVGTSAKGNQTDSIEQSFSASSTITFSKSAGKDWSNKFFSFVFNVSVSGTSNKFLEFKSAAFYADAGPVETYTVSFNGNGGTGEMSSVSDVSGDYTLPANGFVAPSGKAFSGWKASNAGDLIPAGGSYNVSSDVTFFAQWADAYQVSYSAGEHGSGTFSHGLQPGENYQLLAFSELEGVSAASGYRFKNYTVGGADKNPGDTISFNAATTITVNFEEIPMETTYDFTTNFGTYASGWNTTYGTKTLAGTTDIGGDYAASIVLLRVNKQSTGVGSERPYIAGNTNADAKIITFTLTEVGYKIVDVVVTFEQRSSNTPALKLFKGDTNTGTPLDSATIGTKNTLSTSNLNDTVFTVTLNAGGTSNKGCGLTSIYISLAPLSSFGTLDHISITGFPNVVYHVGESYSSLGFAVTAYDGADESTANFKDVTSQVSQTLEDAYIFVENDVPGWEEEVEYTEDEKTVSVSYHIYVYALAQYELVTITPADWSGNYLIISTNGDSELVAMNGGLDLIDSEHNYKVVSESDNIIEAGQELEWTIASYSEGYSIQGKSGKYIGSLTADNNGLLVLDNPIKNTLSVSEGDATITGTNGHKLSFNTTGDRFRYYSSGSVKLYKLKTSDHADEYAQTFLGAIKCDASGENEPDFNIKEGEIKWSWALLASAYNELTPVEKEEFRLGVASKTGNNIEQALARYDLIVGKYGKDKYSDFMLRNPDPIPTNNVTSVNFDSNNSLIIIVIAISSVTVLSLGVLIVLKKKKHN